MPGPARKRKDRSQRLRKGVKQGSRQTKLTLHQGGGRIASIPGVPDGLLKSTRESWKNYWHSNLAQIVQLGTDMSAIIRLFTLYDERERAYRSYKKHPLVEGSQGQMVLNPMGRQMSVLDTEIRQLEDRLGMTPRARLQLGITYGEAKKSLKEINREIQEQD